MARWLLLILSGIFTCKNAHAQQFKLEYSGIPEMYNEVEITLIKDGEAVDFNKKKGKYHLIAKTATLKGSTLQFYRQKLYDDSGIIYFTLTKEAKELSLQLPILQAIHFNLYADSIKPLMNYYLNIEGTFSNNTTYPLDTSYIEISANNGTVISTEWSAPAHIKFDKVTFTATCKYDTTLRTTKTVFLKKAFISKE